MLTDQKFSAKPIIVLGPSAFMDEVGDLSYTTALYLRELPSVQEIWDFHYVATDTDDNRHTLEVLQSWGAPLQLGQFFRAQPTPQAFKEFLRMINAVEKIHSKEICTLYRYAGRKNISTILGEKLFHALSIAAVDPEPGALTKHLLRGDL